MPLGIGAPDPGPGAASSGMGAVPPAGQVFRSCSGMVASVVGGGATRTLVKPDFGLDAGGLPVKEVFAIGFSGLDCVDLDCVHVLLPRLVEHGGDLVDR
jgi:hypothetical protein